MNNDVISQSIKMVTDLFQFNNDNEYINLIALSVLIFFIITLMKKMVEKIYMTFQPDAIKRYNHNRTGQIALNIILIIALYIIWEGHIKSLITIISFVSAAATIALREIIFNFFAGIYIRVKKPFVIDDMIEVSDIRGDVVSLNALTFEILETGNRIQGEQSSGIIVSFPNSLVITDHIRNYVKQIKYIWKELTIRVPIDSDIEGIKNEIYTIIRENEILKKIPKKMKNQMGSISLNYRINISNLEPIIYTKIVEDHVELYARYLVNPRKARFVEDHLWNQILEAYKEKKIELYLANGQSSKN